MKRVLIDQGWKMRSVDGKQFYEASVPGSVYLDLLRAGQMKDPFWKDEELEALKLMEHDHEYVTTVFCDEEMKELSELLLVFEGLDTLAEIYVNGRRIGYADNMHRTWRYPVKSVLNTGANELKILFRSPTKYIREAFEKSPTLGTEDAMNGFVHIRKAHYMFGWDWGAHLPDAGIWRPVYLEAIDRAKIESVEIRQFHEDGRVRLVPAPEISIFAPDFSEKDMEIRFEIKDPDGNRISEGPIKDEIVIDHPRLWWPNGLGPQNLYTICVTLCDMQGRILDEWSRRIGLRTLTMDRSKDQWGEKFATCVNGVNFFAMGADYIPEDHLLGRVTAETTEALLKKAVFANFNSIRVWGGGHYPNDWFYDLCDELGLVVWQDFMFACAVYDLTPEFEENITAEIIDNLKRIRHHASLGLMCGNNEMEQFVKERTWVSKDSEVRDYIIMYERIMPKLMKEYAPQVFYWPASPSSGGSFDDPRDENRGDVHYWDVWHGNAPFSEYRKHYFRYLSEFGFQSFPARKTIETFTDDEEDMNIFSYIFERHQRNGAANGKIMNYMQQTFKYPTGFDTIIYASQLLQAEAIRYGVEHLRRNRTDDRCMGAVYWQFNDCWPVASWSGVDYHHRLKALHYYARRFFAPVMISCEEEGMLGSGQELVRLPFEFPKSIRLNVTNETLREETVEVEWELRDASARVLRSERERIRVPALSAVWLDRTELPDIDIYAHYVSYRALIDEKTVSEGTVIFSYPKYFRYEDPGLSYELSGDSVTVYASKYAKSVEIQNENEDLILTDNYFDLNGDSKTVKILKGEPENLRLRSVYDIR